MSPLVTSTYPQMCLLMFGIAGEPWTWSGFLCAGWTQQWEETGAKGVLNGLRSFMQKIMVWSCFIMFLGQLLHGWRCFFWAFAAIDANKIYFLLPTDFLQSSTSWSARAFLALLAKHLWGYVHDFPTILPIIQFEHVSNHPALHSNRPRNASPEGGPCQPRRGNSSWIIHGMCKPMLQWCKVRSQDSKSDIHTDGSTYDIITNIHIINIWAIIIYTSKCIRIHTYTHIIYINDYTRTSFSGASLKPHSGSGQRKPSAKHLDPSRWEEHPGNFASTKGLGRCGDFSGKTWKVSVFFLCFLCFSMVLVFFSMVFLWFSYAFLCFFLQCFLLPMFFSSKNHAEHQGFSG